MTITNANSAGTNSMVPLNEHFTIAAPCSEVWPLLGDPVMLAACIPGAALTERAADGSFRGNLTFKFGPTVAVFRGETTFTYDHAAMRGTLRARGIDQRGATRAMATFEFAATGTESTQVSLDGGFDVSGPLEMFAKAGGVHVARALMTEFASNIARAVQERRAGSAVEDAAAPASRPQPAHKTVHPPQSADGLRMAWRTFCAWLKHILGKQRKE